MTPTAALEAGLSIIPCGRDKRPIIPSWKPYQTRQTTDAEFSDWSRLNPATWALVTGAISHRITLDFDGVPGCQTLELLGLRPHRRTPSGGYHVDFRHPGWHVPTLNSKSKRELGERWPNLDIRADGGYVVFCGRTDRGAYEWLRDPEPYELDILPSDLREFLGLLHPPAAAPEQRTNDNKVHTMPASGRVDGEQLIRMALDRVGSEGRNNAGFWLGAQLRDNGHSIGDAESVLRNYRSRCPSTDTKSTRAPYTEREMQATLKEVYSHPPRDPWKQRAPAQSTMAASTPEAEAEPEPATAESPADHLEGPPERESVPDLLCKPYTDTGNAERLVMLYGRDTKFCSELRRWLVWDGRRWKSENTRPVKVLAKRTIRLMYAQAADIAKADLRGAAEKHARLSESAAAINSMLACAEYEEGIPISANELDRDPYLLNFLNGTLDLRSDKLREHRRGDLITKLVHHNYDEQASCPLFMKMLFRIMGDGPDASDQARERADRLVAYLKKCFGYALTGDVSDKAVFCFFGAGNNGKTTLLEIIRFVLTEYSTQVLIDSLMTHNSRESNASLADLGDLRGARFVTTSEAEEGQRLAVGKLKYLSQGMGDIKTCRKYENPITFTATHKLFLDANHKPVIRGAEKAVWNRLKPIPFTVTIPPEEMDKALLEKLKGEAEGILAWMVEGCKLWMRDGLGDPPEVTNASAAWQAESDRFPAFLEEKCVLSPNAWVPVSQLWPAYQNWCEANNERFVLPKATFDERIKETGCTQGKRENGATRAWLGIRFRTHDDDRKDEQQDNGT